MQALGNKVQAFDGEFDLFAKPENVDRVTMRHIEFTSICPVTGQPDTGTVEITYMPQSWCLESKSLKLYLQTFRDKGTFCEALAHEIAQTLSDALNCRTMVVEVKQNARGGVELECIASVVRPTDEEVEAEARRDELSNHMRASIQKMMRQVEEQTSGVTSETERPVRVGWSVGGEGAVTQTDEHTAPSYVDRLRQAMDGRTVGAVVVTDSEGNILLNRGVSFARKYEPGEDSEEGKQDE